MLAFIPAGTDDGAAASVEPRASLHDGHATAGAATAAASRAAKRSDTLIITFPW